MPKLHVTNTTLHFHGTSNLAPRVPVCTGTGTVPVCTVYYSAHNTKANAPNSPTPMETMAPRRLNRTGEAEAESLNDAAALEGSDACLFSGGAAVVPAAAGPPSCTVVVEAGDVEFAVACCGTALSFDCNTTRIGIPVVAASRLGAFC